MSFIRIVKLRVLYFLFWGSYISFVEGIISFSVSHSVPKHFTSVSPVEGGLVLYLYLYYIINILLPQSKIIPTEENFLLAYSIQSQNLGAQLSSQDFLEIWCHYDKDCSGYLDFTGYLIIIIIDIYLMFICPVN